MTTKDFDNGHTKTVGDETLVIEPNTTSVSALPQEKLFVELTESSYEIELGGEVCGEIIIHAPYAIDCRKVTVNLAYRTQGSGITDRHQLEEIVLHSGRLAAGQHAFEFGLPLTALDSDQALPISYQGKHVSIIWSVHARIDIAFDSDIDSEVGFKVISSAPRQIRVLATDENLNSIHLGMVIFVSAIFFVIFIILLLVCILGDDTPWWFYLISLAAGMPTLLGVTVFIPKIMRSRKLGEVRIDTQDYQPNSGLLLGKVLITPKANVEVNSIEVSLEGVEMGSSRSEGNGFTYLYAREVSSDDIVKDSKLLLPAAITKAFPFTLQVPEGLSPEFTLDHNALNWTIALKIQSNICEFADSQNIEVKLS